MAPKSIVKRSTGLVKWDAELAKYAEDASAAEKLPGGSFISFRGGQISIAGQPSKGPIQVVVLDSIFENACYEGDYDADNPQPPVCYGFARSEDDLKPHAEAADPKCESCAGCEMNQWGSADKGKGKACKNVRRLAVVSANGLSADSVKKGEVFYIKLPVTSVKGWAMYVKSLAATTRRPPFAYVTEIECVPDPKSQFKVTFAPVEPVPDDVMGAVMERRKEIEEQIAFPYPKPGEKQEKAPKKSRKF
jgi:hypothetical protein